MRGHQRITLAVVQGREAPGVAKRYQVRLARVEVDEEGLGTEAHLAHAGELVNFATELSLDQARPDNVGGAVSSDLKVGEEAVDDIRFGGENVYGVHLGVMLATILDTLDCWVGWSAGQSHQGVGMRLEVNELAILLLRMSSSLTALSMIFLEVLSTTRHFH